MTKSEKSFYNPDFSHVYVEKRIGEHPKTLRILDLLPKSAIIYVDHYKDVFCKGGQSYESQTNSKKLILAKKTDTFLYEGSNLCDSFGNENFYYTTNAMNCIYGCEYCYLQGMYLSANLVVFVNIEDTFSELEKRLRDEKLYVCNSYDTDLMAIEGLTGFASDWIDFATEHVNLTVELRTKSANFASIATKTAIPNFYLAWSVSPEEYSRKYEHNTPGLSARIESMSKAIENGWKVRLCIDPAICGEDWKDRYSEMVSEIKRKIDIRKFTGVSIGVFRVPKDSLKIMRNINHESSLLAYPYIFDTENECWTYENKLAEEMTDFIRELLGVK
jgi:spore photoproduct lyase